MPSAVNILILDTCSLGNEIGPGRAAIPRYFYDKDLKVCSTFIYGGVGGNANNFESKEACQTVCGEEGGEGGEEGGIVGNLQKCLS